MDPASPQQNSPSAIDLEPKAAHRHHKEGCGLNIQVLGITLEHHEKSRASKVNCINNKVPSQRLDLLKTDEERRKSVQQYQQLKESKLNGQKGGFFDKQERELANIVKQIERVRAAKLEMAQDNNTSSGAENKKSTNLIEKTLKQTQQQLDQRRNGPQANANRKSQAGMNNARKGGQGQSQADLPMEGELTEANLNIIQFLNAKPKTKEEMKFMRVITSQGGATFDDQKQNLEEFHRLGKLSQESTAVSRVKHQLVHNQLPNGKDVGAYSPRFDFIERRQNSMNFNGPNRYLSEKQREHMQRRLQRTTRSWKCAESSKMDESQIKQHMKQKRKVQSQIKNLKPTERPDPFKPPKSNYIDRISYFPDGSHCKSCWAYEHRQPVPAAKDHELLKKWADWRYPTRDDICDKPFQRKKNEEMVNTFTFSCPRKTITDDFPNPTDSRFDTAPASSFLAGDHYEQHSQYNDRLRMTGMSSTHGVGKFFTSRSSVNSTTNKSKLSPMYQTFSDRRPIVANLANVPSVKIASYSKRDPDKLFWCQAQHPKSNDTEGHGGLFYDTSKHGKFAFSSQLGNCVPFERKVENKAEKKRKLEEIEQKVKNSQKTRKKKNMAKDIAMENAEMLFRLLHGDSGKENLMKPMKQRSKSNIV